MVFPKRHFVIPLVNDFIDSVVFGNAAIGYSFATTIVAVDAGKPAAFTFVFSFPHLNGDVFPVAAATVGNPWSKYKITKLY